MRSTIKIIKAQNGLVLGYRFCIHTVTVLWIYLLLLLMPLGWLNTDVLAATPPNTELTNVVNVSYAVGEGALIRKAAVAAISTSLRTPAQISFHTQFSGGTPVNVPDTYYAPGSTAIASSWPVLEGGLSGVVPISQTGSFAAGEALLVRVEDFDQNLDPEQQETIIVTLRNGEGDVEVLRLTETSPSSGVFIGSISTVEGVTNAYDGQLSVTNTVVITAQYDDREDGADIAVANALIDPVSMVFDSISGEPINGARIRLVHDKSGRLARVYGTDGTNWPSEVVSGGGVAAKSSKDKGSGKGEFRFPRVPIGEYRFEVIPPPGYRFPSQQSQTQLLSLGDVGIKVKEGSKGERFMLPNELSAIGLNVPLDPFNGRFSVQKAVNKEVASLGDVLEYTVTAQNHDARYPLTQVYLKDLLPPGFRYQSGTAQYLSGEKLPDNQIEVEGRSLTFHLGTLAASHSAEFKYHVKVSVGAQDKVATNTVQGFSGDATSNIARAEVKMLDELMRSEGLLIGRVFSGSCAEADQQQGVKGVRLYLNNGRSVVTDSNGKWHMAGLRPGTHVVQLDKESLAAGWLVSPCKMTSRHAGSASSQFIEMGAGNVWRADFHLKNSNKSVKKSAGTAAGKATAVLKDPLAMFDNAYANKSATPGLKFLWPPEGYVPAISSVKIAVQYQPEHKLKVYLNDALLNPINFEGSASNKKKTVAISRWSGVDIKQKNNTLTAVVTNKAGKEVGRISRHVHFTERSVKASLVKESSQLVADGKQRPVIAVRLEDEDGFTPRPGTHGYFSIESGQWRVIRAEDEVEETVNLNQVKDGRYEYVVSDDGLVRIELEPTTDSGHVLFSMHLSDGEFAPVRAWLQPALRDWIMVGFAKGTLGYQTLSGNMQTLSDLDKQEGMYREGEVSFFAKGRIKGDFLLTLAYDSRKEKGEVGEQLDGVIESDKWYALYGDDQSEQYSAPTSSKLYLKLEKQQFSALFGDYQTDLNVTQLGKYQRVLHGFKSVYEGENVGYTAFASRTSLRHQYDEMRGDGTSGRYHLSRKPVSNSEKVFLQTRDRDHPEVILESRALGRHIDYEIDYQDESLFFKFPVSATDDAFNPLFIAVDYESEEDSGKQVFTTGGRIAYTSDDKRLQTGLTAIREEGVGSKVVIDSDFKVNDQLRIKAEAGQSDQKGENRQRTAWQIEADYRASDISGRLYAKEQEAGFGLGEQGKIGVGSRKIGAEVRYFLTEDSSLHLDTSHQVRLDEDSERTQGEVKWQKQFDDSQFDIGYLQTEDKSEQGTVSNKQVILGGSKSFTDIGLSVSARLEKGLGSTDDIAALPDRARLGLDYNLTEKTTVFAEQEWSRSQQGDSADQSRVGLKTVPWEGGKLYSGLVRENKVGESEVSRDYGNLGLSQHWQVNDKLSVDVSVDKMETLNDDVITPAVAGDGESSGLKTDDYLSISMGAGWNDEDWGATGRAEWRDGEVSERKLLKLGVVKKLDKQRTVSMQTEYLTSSESTGYYQRDFKVGLNLALRPERIDTEGSWFNRFEWVDKKETSIGENSHSRKAINNLHYNRRFNQNMEFSFHHGIKLNLGDEEGQRYRGLIDTVQAALRFDVDERFDVGVQGGYLSSWDDDSRAYFSGVSAGFSPADDVRVEVGYNFSGFDDDDFSSGNYTYQGPYVDFSYKLDHDLMEALKQD